MERVHMNRLLVFASILMLTMNGCTRATERAVSHPDFSGVWTSPGAEYVHLPEQTKPKFTSLAATNLAHYESNYDIGKDDPAVVCFLKGMPWTVLMRPRDYPVEIYQTSDRVFMFFVLYDTYRSIRLNEATFPENLPPAANGYSIAHWDNNALIIETRNMPAINPISPYPRSDQARVIERWTIEQHPQLGEILRVAVTVYDPVIYKEPGHGDMIFKRAPAGTKVGGYNCSAQLWDDYVARRESAIAAKTSVSKTAHKAPNNLN